MQNIMDYDTVSLREDRKAVVIIDQTKLPHTIDMLELVTQEEVWEAMYFLKVRGAPAVAMAAAYGIFVGASQIEAENYTEFLEAFMKLKEYLASARPTAVNIFWALDRMEHVVHRNENKSIAEIKTALYEETQQMRDEDIEICRKMGEYGLTLLKDGQTLITHCNAGKLAAIRYGTALAPIYVGIEKGYTFQVYTDETRPLLQGARLSAFELHSSGIDTTVICDNMASLVMKQGKIDACLVGADRIAANGDTVNKIGTSGLAIIAKHYGVPFYVVAPLASFDLGCKTGDDIEIEQRPKEEISTMWYQDAMAPVDANFYNPAFDITVADNITAIVTDYGIVKAPYSDSIAKLFNEAAKNNENIPNRMRK